MKPSVIATHRLALGALGVLFVVHASAAPKSSNPEVDKLFAQWDRKDSPGAAIVVVKDGGVVYQHGYGYANLEHRIPITPQTRFDVASVAKQFTGLSVAMLVEQGKLSLDDDVRKHLPDVPNFGKRITIRHLLYHTSGLRDWPETFLLSHVDFEAPIRFEMILELVRRQRELDFDDDYHGHKMFEHAGGWAAYRSFTMVIPEKRFAVAVLANAANLDPAEQARKIADIYLGMTDTAKSDKKSRGPRTAVKADPATWDAFLGTYRLGAGWLLTITREGDTLMTQATHEAKCKMTPTGLNIFFVAAYNQPVEFVRQESGAVTNLLYRGINAPKLNLPQLTPAGLAAYAGDYWSEELRVAPRMEIHDGYLATRHRSGEWLHFLPTGPDRFDADFGGWALQFTRNESSEITEVKVSGGRVRNVRFARTTLSQPRLPGRNPSE